MEPEVYRRMAEVEASHWWFVARRTILAKAIARLGLPLAATIYELGCGTGGNLELLSRFGAVTGLEPDDWARQRATERGLGQVLAGALPGPIVLPRESADLVAMLDVLEHLDDDRSSLKAAGTLLKRGGRLLLTVPAHPSLWSEHDRRHHHHRRYRIAQVEALSEISGLQVDHISHMNSLLLPVAILQRQIARLNPSAKFANGDEMPGPLANLLLRRLYEAEAPVVLNLRVPFGLSILAVLRKRN